MSNEQLEQWLKNWARWAREHTRFRHCRSAEYRFDSDWWNGWREARLRSDPPFLVHALMVEKALVGPSMPGTYRSLILGHYLYRADPRAICRRLKIRFSDYEASKEMARLMVKNKLLLLLAKRASLSAALLPLPGRAHWA